MLVFESPQLYTNDLGQSNETQDDFIFVFFCLCQCPRLGLITQPNQFSSRLLAQSYVTPCIYILDIHIPISLFQSGDPVGFHNLHSAVCAMARHHSLLIVALSNGVNHVYRTEVSLRHPSARDLEIIHLLQASAQIIGLCQGIP